MLLKELSKTGVQIPEIGIGTWEYHAGPEPLRKGLDAGALFIDTAESYGTEEIVGEAIANRRERVFLATKVSPAHFRRTDLLKAADESLKRLRTDYIDLYQLHAPNESIPLEETLGTVGELVEAGKVRFIGVSNFSLNQLRAAQHAAGRHAIVSNQVRFNIVDRTICKELLPYCHANSITIIAYSPLARGFQHIMDCDPRGVLSELTKSTGRTGPQIALNWCLCKDGVVVIPKANSVERIQENCLASNWRLTANQICLLDKHIVYRRRLEFEERLRRCLPRNAKNVIQRLLKVAPRALRRRIY